MKYLLLLFLVISGISFANENKVIYEGKYIILEGGKILLFYDEHVIEVTQKKHADECWCHKISLNNEK